MRFQFPAALLVALFFSGWYFYQAAHPCISPLPYRLGAIDERFSIEADEAKKITENATIVWEEALGRELFTYDESASFVIDFVYDDRQAKSESADAEKAALDKKENASKSVGAEYDKLLVEYSELKKGYETKVANYNKRLQTFNATVASYNQSGGAPQSEFEALQETERRLKREEATLATEADTLTALASNLNDLSTQGNELISAYNEGVVEYNQTYTGGEEFTQGEYNGQSIEIYHFKDQAELKNVLVHEFGHTIGLPHVDGASSIMYYLMDKQPATSELSKEDLAALSRVCKANDAPTTRFHQFFSSIFITLGLI
jgi:predicted Zn-dependent protease